jgi:hypothetical protein
MKVPRTAQNGDRNQDGDKLFYNKTSNTHAAVQL